MGGGEPQVERRVNGANGADITVECNIGRQVVEDYHRQRAHRVKDAGVMIAHMGSRRERKAQQE